MAEVGVAVELIDLLSVFGVAAIVGIAVAKVGRFPYTIALLLAGLALSVLHVDVGIELTHDLILLVLLPPLLFEGAATLDLSRFRRNLPHILVLAIPGLMVSIVLLGVAAQYVLGFSLLVSLLFAATILPTDPVSVLALFDELGAPDRLSVLVEGESLINDGVGVVVFTALLGLVTSGVSADALLQPARLFDFGVELVYVSVGGLLVGLAAGYGVYGVLVNLDEHMTEVVLTLILAYGSFVVAEHYLHVSGVIATVAAGLFIGNRGADRAMSARTKVSVFTTWETAAFIANTFIFVAIGARTPVGQLLDNVGLIAAAIVLVLLARAAIVYPSVALVNRWIATPVPWSHSHVMIWGGLHASIPIALVLGLPADAPLPRAKLTAIVFGVAAFSLVVQGLTMGNLLNHLGVVTRTESEELYELLLGRARAVSSALDAAESLYESGDISRSVYEDFEAEYSTEQEELNRAIAALLAESPELRREQLLMGERQVLRREKSAIMDASRTGAIADDVADRLSEEVDLKLDAVNSGQSTVHAFGEGYREFWRERVDEFGLDVDVSTGDDQSGE